MIRNILILSERDRLYTSESEVYRRQILTNKDCSRAERINLTTPLVLLQVTTKRVLFFVNSLDVSLPAA